MTKNRNQTARSPRAKASTSMRSLFSSLLVTMLLLSVGLGITLYSFWTYRDVRSSATNNGPVMYIDPPTKPLRLGETASYGIILVTNEDRVSAAQIHIAYDPSALSVTSVSKGTILPVELSAPKTSNGLINVTVGSGATTPFKGSGIVATFTIKANAEKQSTLHFTGDTLVASVGKTGNTLAFVTDSTITAPAVIVIPTSTPAPTHKPTSTPTTKPLISPTMPPSSTEQISLQGAAIYPGIQTVMVAYTQTTSTPTFIFSVMTNSIVQNPPGFTRIGGSAEDRPLSAFSSSLKAGDRVQLCTQDRVICSNEVILQSR